MSPQKDDFETVQRWYTTHRLDVSGASVLRWFRTFGYARHDGVSVDMRAPPAICGDDIEYLGGVIGQIDGRDMTPDEATRILEILAKMAQNARDGLEGNCTIVVIVNDKPPPK